MRIEKDYEELLELFNKHNVRYCIVGAFAVGFHGYPRYTKDMDLFVEPSRQNGQRIVDALAEFGFACLNLKPEDFLDPSAIIQLGYEPVRVDLITSLRGCSFGTAWEHRRNGTYGQQKVYFIGLAQLIRNKKIAARPQDRVDLDRLVARTKGQ